MPLELEEREYFRFYDLPPGRRREVLDRVREALRGSGEVLLAIVFGSFMEHRPFRDIDLAVYVRGVGDYLDYKFALERDLSATIGYPVDVHLLNNAPPWLTLVACLEGELLYARKRDIHARLCKKALEEVEGIRIKNRVLAR